MLFYHPQSVDIKTHSNAGLLGVSVMHTAKATGPKTKFADSVDMHTIADSESSAADVFHSVAGLSFTDSQRINLRPDEAQKTENKILTQKRFNPQWLKMTEKNVKSGVVKSTLNDKTRYLVTAKCPKTGADSAIHTLMVQNSANPKV